MKTYTALLALVPADEVERIKLPVGTHMAMFDEPGAMPWQEAQQQVFKPAWFALNQRRHEVDSRSPDDPPAEAPPKTPKRAKRR